MHSARPLSKHASVARFPGIEATYNIARLGTYHAEAHLRRDFRINLEHPAGFLTEKMALPWQADYADCSDHWWPSQRPVHVTKQDGTPNQQWDRGINGRNLNGHLNMVKLWFNLAFVLRDPRPANLRRLDDSRSMASPDREAAILVVGGGPAGLATASALAGKGLDVSVVERSDYRDIRIGEHHDTGGAS